MRTLAALLILGTGRLSAADAPDFTREVRPILSQYCFKCHGPDEQTRKGELRLDSREAALKPAESGEPAIVPGKPDASELIARILTDEEDDVMPPRSTKRTLTPEQKDILNRWVAAGAEYRDHWSFIAPKRPAVSPVVNARVQNPIDAFVVAKLTEAGLAQSPPADPATLARRMHLDLIGLPPTVEELDAFLAESAKDSAGAIERLVERLLASPQYGERWARRWLDLARYADTNGYEKDRDRSIWPYRDWVIQALNADMPYDQFTIEQLAGDLLPNATPQQRIATGFHRNTMLNEEGGIDPLEFRYHAMVDRVATTGITWLGLTVGCAQCHTHKYDPITHREYFQMFAFLNNADELDLTIAPPDAAAQDVKRTAKASELLAALPDQWPAKDGEKPAEAAEAHFEKWLETARKDALPWKRLRPSSAKSNLPLLTVQPDDSVYASGDITKSDAYELRFEDVPGGVTAIRLEALPDPRLPAQGPGMAYYEGPKGDFFMGEFEASVNGRPVKFARATESYGKNNFGGKSGTAAAATDGDLQTGWSCAGRMGEAHEAVFVPSESLAAGPLEVKMTFGRHYACSLGRFRISVTTAPGGADARGWPEDVGNLLQLPEAALTAGQRARLREHFFLSAPELAEKAKEIRTLRQPAKHPTTLIFQERPPENPRPTFIHHRGEFTQPTDRVEAGVLSVLNPLPAEAPRNRLTFARWLVSREHPLAARVAVNRAWAAFFGRGLVRTTEDFGFQGEVPSHPELLDWLAVEFMDGAWSQKKLHRLIVLSATYQQAARVTPELLAKDPENRLLARFPRQRLEAEVMRDAALRSSDLLVLKAGGPSVRPPQPEGVTEVAYGSPKWNADSGENRYRRSLYTYAKRTAPFALYNVFDAPTGESCVARRDVSNTPLQALTLLNDQVFLEAAAALGSKAAKQGASPEDRLRLIYRALAGREPAPEEATAALQFVDKQRSRFAAGELAGEKKEAKTPDELAWGALVRALLNLDEVMTKG